MQTDGRTDRRYEANSRFSKFYERTSKLKGKLKSVVVKYTDVCETDVLARSINTQPAVRRNSETNPTSQHNRGMY